MNSYEINVETLLIVPFGKGKSKVYEYDSEYEVNMSPLAIIKNSCLYFGSSYEGRKEAIKSMIGIDMKVPIIIEEISLPLRFISVRIPQTFFSLIKISLGHFI